MLPLRARRLGTALLAGALVGLLPLIGRPAGGQVVGPTPSIRIAQPAAGARFFVGDPITLQASADDGDGTDLGVAVAWDSDREGALGVGAVVLTTLTRGTHTVTAAVTDARGASAADRVVIEVVDPPAGNTPPLVTITAPATDQPLAAGPPIVFVGSAHDLDDGDLTPGLLWTSDRDGALGVGGRCSHPLSQGIHRITARVTDAGGLAAASMLVVQVGPPVTLEFIPTADTYVDAGAPATGFGASPILRVDANTARHAYLRFVVSGLGGRAIRRATLHLQVDTGESAGSDSGGAVYALDDPNWQEGAVTYRTHPTASGPALATAGPVARGQVVDFDVTPAVTGDGTYGFALLNGSSDEATYRSREGGPPPRLILTLTGNPPVVTITAPQSGTVVRRGDAVGLRATATDLEDGDLGTTIVWASSRDGLLGSGASLTAGTLGLGMHTITATAVDAQGAVGTDQVQLTVLPPLEGGTPPPTTPPAPDTPPVVTIAGPASDARLITGRPVVLAAVASDAEDGDLSAAVRWTSSRDGGLGAGGTVVVPSLSVGMHTLTATVLDHGGTPAAASITVSVLPSTLAVPAVADTYVDAGTPQATFGSAPVLQAGLAPAPRQAFFRFTVNGVGDLAVQQATLHLTVRQSSTAGGTLRTITDHAWSESGMTYATRPTIDGPALGTQGGVGAGQAVDFDVTAAVVGDGTYDFALLSAAPDGVAYASREAGTGAPVLLLTLAARTAPVVTIRAPSSQQAVDRGASVSFIGTATDADGRDLTGRLRWTSSIDGLIGTGGTVTVPSLSVGMHMVAATVVGAGGTTADAHTMVQVRRVNVAPGVRILAPAAAARVPVGQSVRLAALVTDDTDQDIATRLEWRSSRDGALGTGPTRTVTLSPGAHTITALATDSGGLTSSAAVTLLIDTRPTVVITGPANGTVAIPGVPLALAAQARDPEDGDLTARVTWTSSLDGVLGTGSPLVARTLRSGLHTLTASVTDAAGTVASTSITLLVNAPPSVAITAPVPFWRFAPGDAVVLAATATDPEDGDVSARVVWSSSLDGPLGAGGRITVTSLSAGTHVLTATVSDGAGTRASATTVLSPFACLAQPGPLVLLAGLSTTSYAPLPLAPATRIDARTATFIAAATNRYPLNLTGGAGICVAGGTVLGQYDRSLSWNEMHYVNNNAGVAFDDTGTTVDGVRVDDVTDGIRPRAGEDFAIRNVRLSYIRDDCVENDHLHGGLVDDSLLDGCYVAFSARPSQAIIDSGYSGVGKLWTIQHSLVRLQPMPGPDGSSPDGLGTGGFFKWHLWDDPTHSLSPKIALHDNVFLAERAGVVSPDRMGIPPDQLASCSNNVMVWLGAGPYPASLPGCFTVTTDRGVWDAAVADWERRHPQVPR